MKRRNGDSVISPHRSCSAVSPRSSLKEQPRTMRTPCIPLIIVPCGRSKVWDRSPDLGPTAAQDAYVGGPFKLNRAYAERFGQRWVILSAKYGFIDPAFVIPGPYDTTFLKPA